MLSAIVSRENMFGRILIHGNFTDLSIVFWRIESDCYFAYFGDILNLIIVVPVINKAFIAS